MPSGGELVSDKQQDGGPFFSSPIFCCEPSENCGDYSYLSYDYFGSTIKQTVPQRTCLETGLFFEVLRPASVTSLCGTYPVFDEASRVLSQAMFIL